MCSLAAAYNFSIVFDRLIKLRENINMSVDVAAAEKKKKPLMAEGLLLAASMVLVQGFTIGALLLSKVAFNIGMAPFVLLAYRNLIGSISVAPFAFYFERYILWSTTLATYFLCFCRTFFGLCSWTSIIILFK
jgi:hypothetical protein